MSQVNIFGVRVSNVTVDDILHKIDEILASENRGIITHVHVMGLNLAYEQEWFRDFLNQSKLVYCDGMGVKLGARFLGEPSLNRITMADWIYQFADFSQQKGYSWFLLGNSLGASEKASQIIKNQYPDLNIVGTYHGFFNKSPGHPENEYVLKLIRETDPDILFVGLGMPSQEKWLSLNWHLLPTPLAITCGGIFDVLTGINTRGPAWLNQFYLEWLARFLKSPIRYWQRYLVGNPLFLWRVIEQRFSLDSSQQ